MRHDVFAAGYSYSLHTVLCLRALVSHANIFLDKYASSCQDFSMCNDFKYIVISLTDKRQEYYRNEIDVAASMLGRNFAEWLVFQRQDKLPVNVLDMELVLKSRFNAQSERFLG